MSLTVNINKKNKIENKVNVPKYQLQEEIETLNQII